MVQKTRQRNRQRTRQRTRQRSQRGGFWPFDSETTVDPNAPVAPVAPVGFLDDVKKSGSELLGKGSNLLDNLIAPAATEEPPITQSVAQPVATEKPAATEEPPVATNVPQVIPPITRGGRPLGLTYYATPVNGIRMAEPTYMEYYNGGSRRRRRRRRSKKQRSRRLKRRR